MNVTLRSAMVLLLSLAATGCSGISVQTMHDSTADFAAYRTFDWAAVPEQARTAVDDVSVLDLLTAELEAKGLHRSAESPDLRVAMHRFVQGELNTHRWGYSLTAYGMSRHDMQSGTLIVDLIDPKKKESVWRGTAQGVFDFQALPAEKLEIVRVALQEMFAKYPPD